MRFAYTERCYANLLIEGLTVRVGTMDDEDEQRTAVSSLAKTCHGPGGKETPCTGTVGAFASGNPFSLPTACLDVAAVADSGGWDCSFYANCLEKTRQCGPSGYALGFGKFYCEAFGAAEVFEQLDLRGQRWVGGTATCLQRAIIQSGLLEDASPDATCDGTTDTAFRLHHACYVRNGFCDMIFGNVEAIYAVFYDSDEYGGQAWQQICTALQHCAETDAKLQDTWSAAFADTCPMRPAARSLEAESISYSVFPNGMELSQLKDTPWGAFDVDEYVDPFHDDWVAPLIDGCHPVACCKGRSKTCGSAEQVLPTLQVGKHYTAGDFMSRFRYEEGTNKGMVSYLDERLAMPLTKASQRNQFFRLDARMVECVDQLQSAYAIANLKINIKVAYRTKSEALFHHALNPHEDTFPSRFQTGAAVRLEFEADARPHAELPPDMGTAQTLCLRYSVGSDGTNEAMDVQLVVARLKELGFTPCGTLTWQIKMFQCIVTKGCKKPSPMSGVIEPGDEVHLWLQATNAPRWQRLAGRYAGVGFEDTDNHDWGTSWLQEVLEDVGRDLFLAWPETRPKLKKRSRNRPEKIVQSTFRLSVNDASKSTGGYAPPHTTHQIGLSADLRPLRDLGFHAGGFALYDNVAWDDPRYSRVQNRKIVQALARHDQITTIYYNDPVLLQEVAAGTLSSKLSYHNGHDNHLHIAIARPAREGASSTSFDLLRDCTPGECSQDGTGQCQQDDSDGMYASSGGFQFSANVEDKYVDMARMAVRVCYPIFTDYDRIIALGLGRQSLQIELRDASTRTFHAGFTPMFAPGDEHPEVAGALHAMTHTAWATPGARLSTQHFWQIVNEEINRIETNFPMPARGRMPPQAPNPDYVFSLDGDGDGGRRRSARSTDTLTKTVEQRAICGSAGATPCKGLPGARAWQVVLRVPLEDATEPWSPAALARTYTYNTSTWSRAERLAAARNLTRALMAQPLGPWPRQSPASERARREGGCKDAAATGFLRVNAADSGAATDLPCSKVSALGFCTHDEYADLVRSLCPVSCGACGAGQPEDVLNREDSFCYSILQGGAGGTGLGAGAGHGIVDAYAELYSSINSMYASGAFDSVPHKPWLSGGGGTAFAYGKDAAAARDDVESAMFRCFLPCDDKGSWLQQIGQLFASKANKAGTAWAVKMAACESFLHWVAPDPTLWGNVDNSVHFASSQNERMRGNARFWGQALEEVPLYGIIVPHFERTFLDSDGEETRFHDDRLNPSPIYDVFQRLYAMVARGKVTFWVSHASEVLGLRKVLMIVMGYNPTATEVEIRAPQAAMPEVKIQMYEWVDVFKDTLYATKRKQLAQLRFHAIGAVG